MKLYSLRFFTILCFLILQCTYALYEDQVGKFDWRKRHIGRPIVTSSLEDKYCDRIIFTTEENVIAALSTQTGDIIWRQILEKSPRGELKYTYIRPEDSAAVSLRHSSQDYDILTVSGSYPVLVRGWLKATGNLVFEWTPTSSDQKGIKKSYWFYKDNTLYNVISRDGSSNVEVTQYYALTGELRRPTIKIHTSWSFKGVRNCFVVDTYYVCTDSENKNRLIAKDLAEENAPDIEKFLVEDIITAPKAIEGYKGVLLINNHEIVDLENSLAKYDASDLRKVLDTSLKCDYVHLMNYEGEDYLVAATVKDEVLSATPYYINQFRKAEDLEMNISYTKEFGPLSSLTYNCYKARSLSNPSCVALICSIDGAIMFAKNGNVQWTREESLSRIAAIEWIDLPLSGTQSDFENEIQKTTDQYGKKYDIWGAFVRRIESQLHLLKNIRFHIFDNQPLQQKIELTRDAFGLHKIIVVLTEYGKIFGIDNISGEQHWAIYHPSLARFNNNENMKIIVQKTSKYAPHQPLCTILAKDKETGNGIIYRFSPITGTAIDDGPIKLNYKIKQMALLRENPNDHTKGILLLDQNNEIHVIPKNSTEMAEGMYIYIADKSTASIDGYFIKKTNENLGLLKVWSINLGGIRNPPNPALSNHIIIAIAAKNPIERVHSQGRVLGDRSVLYKYLNPNLVAVVTSSVNSLSKDLNVHLVDVVAGTIVYSMTHRKCRPPVHIVNSENWLVYSYFNEKARRTEITTVELYEGKVQSNSTVWSSLEAPPFPIIEKQSFIIPTIVEAMRETITERGITNKHVLIGTSSGAIAEMAWALLDPRRPTSNQAREEGTIPYIPELGIPSETIINYNQSIARLKDISTAPSGLESTCLVVAYGLDLFVTRVSPSKTFDLLKEDFDYMLISLVLIGLLVVSCIVQHLSSRKALKQAWK